MRSILLAVVFGGLFASGAAFAADSGCGLGNVIIQKNSKGLQLLSWTTNGLFFTQPLGITSGTSGCSSSGLVSNDKKVQYFVEVNQDDISREMAQGQGEKLETLAELSGCRDDESRQAFYSMTKDSYNKIVTSAKTSSQELVSNLKTQMMEDEDVAFLCDTASL